MSNFFAKVQHFFELSVIIKNQKLHIMDLSGRRQSNNYEDRRGKGGKVAGLGIGGALIVGILALLFGGNPSEVIQQLGSQAA